MAIGFDSSLRRTVRSPLAQPPAATMRYQPPPLSPPPSISDTAVQRATNAQMSAGYGTRESALRDSDRRGISRGAGQNYYASMAQEAADSQAAAEATKIQMDAAAGNARAQQEYDSALANENLVRQGLLEGLRNDRAMSRLASSGYQSALRQAMLRGRFGLDSMQLDYTPLLRTLLE